MRVSVIIPTFNRLRELRTALASVQTQTLAPLETIVVNDGGSPLALPEYVHVLATTHNRGPAAARNTGARAARGDYLCFLDDDDVLAPSHLAVLAAGGWPLAHSRAHWVVDVACAGGRSIERRIGRGASPPPSPASGSAGRSISYEYDDPPCSGMPHLWVPTMSMLVERQTFIAAGGYDESLDLCEDSDLLLRLLRQHPMACVDTVTCEYRRRVVPGRRRRDPRAVQAAFTNLFARHPLAPDASHEERTARAGVETALAARIALADIDVLPRLDGPPVAATIFGAGSSGMICARLVAAAGFPIAGVVDNDALRWGTHAATGHPVEPPTVLATRRPGLIVISSSWAMEIAAQLDTMGFPRGRDGGYYHFDPSQA